jgi:NADH:ubiquinone oxidoreductase subunit 2 (subunit N)
MNRVKAPTHPSKWETLGEWRLGGVAVLFMLALGLLHIPMQLASYLPWEDPRSYRKPILFGVSTGLTLGSLLLLMNDLRPKRWDRYLRGLLSATLVAEVLLITVQSWRHVPSHFNRSSITDASIENAMLGCILLAVAVIVALTFRAFQRDAFPEASPARILAQRSGMIFLILSCFLGIGITILGNYLMHTGGSPEKLGNNGVLKFPHGVVLHAIQTLVLWSWICDVFGSARGALSVFWLAASHMGFLAYALRQTLLGRGRWETDDIGWIVLGCTVVSAVVSLLIAIWQRKR